MTDGTGAHALIQANLLRALFDRSRGSAFRALGSKLEVRTDSSVRYPDALITCSRVDPRSTFAPDPVVLFDILSRSSAGVDLGAKNAEYQTRPSLERFPINSNRLLSFPRKRESRAAARRVPLDPRFRGDDNSGWSDSALKRYVVLHQSLAAAEGFHRDAEGEWVYEFISAPGALEMREVGVTFPLSQIYEDIEFVA